ncbi:MAG TPA: hypothetical protein VGY31_12400 [Terriglobia bacterium]|nr:hypothetical protein [Terriglobia bacterium]
MTASHKTQAGVATVSVSLTVGFGFGSSNPTVNQNTIDRGYPLSLRF